MSVKKERRRYPENILANREPVCILSRCKLCQQAQWCHDMTVREKAILARPENPEVRTRTNSIRLQQVQASVEERGRSILSASSAVLALRKRNRKSWRHDQTATLSMLPAPLRLLHRLGLSPLFLLEVERFLWRFLCWLLRTFVGSFFHLTRKIKKEKFISLHNGSEKKS